MQFQSQDKTTNPSRKITILTAMYSLPLLVLQWSSSIDGVISISSPVSPRTTPIIFLTSAGMLLDWIPLRGAVDNLRRWQRWTYMPVHCGAGFRVLYTVRRDFWKIPHDCSATDFLHSCGVGRRERDRACRRQSCYISLLFSGRLIEAPGSQSLMALV